MGNFSLDFIYYIPGVISAIVFYVYAQAKVAENLGDMTPRFFGRITLNPFAHIDFFGLICLLFFHIGWAKPVPINKNNFKNPKIGDLKVNLAGPFANLFLAFFLVLSLIVLDKTNSQNITLILIVNGGIMYNLYFAFFNLIPIPPLTGARILAYFLPYRYANFLENQSLNMYNYLFLLGLMFLGVFGKIIEPLAKNTFLLMVYIGNSILGFF